MHTYAYSTMLYVVLSPLKAAERILELGLPVEISYDNFFFGGGRAVEDRFIGELLESALELRGSVRAIHMPYDEMEPQKALTDVVLKRFNKWLDMAYRLEVGVAVIHTLKIDENHEKSLDLNLEFLGAVQREAEDRGILLAVENRLEKNFFGSKPRDLLRIIRGLGGGVGICLDVGHANINRNLGEFLALGSHIVAMHLHDNDGHRDLHKPPYTGTVDWASLEKWVSRSLHANSVLIFEVSCNDNAAICDQTTRQISLTPIANL